MKLYGLLDSLQIIKSLEEVNEVFRNQTITLESKGWNTNICAR